MDKRRPLIAGNWKMNLSFSECRALVRSIRNIMGEVEDRDVLVAPPFTYLGSVKEWIKDSDILLGAQNMHWEEGGAFTGEISASMLIDVGCTHVILGHSERRQFFGETNEIVNLKVKRAIQARLAPILCVGENLSQREEGITFDIVREQLEGSLASIVGKRDMPYNLSIAYEPVWAIGTGRTATPDQAQEVHEFIREWIWEKFTPEASQSIRILYGGSVKPENISDLMREPDIDGVLVGGASLKAELFIPIIKYDI